jgi:RimJ/RimL family protein N-acetyltransferase
MGLFAAREVGVSGGERVRLRAVVADDAAALLEFLRRESATTDQVLTQPDEFPNTIEEERHIIGAHERAGGVLIVAVREGEHGLPPKMAAKPWHGQIIGVMSVRPGHRKRSRHTSEFGITVAEAWRGRGVGTAMMLAMLDWARAHETIEKVCLQVFATNPRAIALYQRLGFVEEGRQAGQAQITPGRYVDDLHMGLWVKSRNGGG